MPSYSFTIATAFPNSVAAIDRLTSEIQSSEIITALDYINVASGICDVVFKSELSPGDEDALDALIAAHSGAPLVQPVLPLSVDVTGPKEADGKQIVVISPATEGMKTWLTSRGDDLGAGATGRGKGTKLRIAFEAGVDTFPITKTVDCQFLEPVEVHDGQFNWTPAAFDAEDEFDVSVVMPASTATSTPGTGNANEFPIGGGAVLYVPAAGDGSHTIDLGNYAEAVPLPASGGGFWDVDDDGVITPSAAPGQAEYHLANFPNEAFLIVGVSMLNTMGLFDVDVYKTEWIHQSWKVRLSIMKTTEGTGVASGWLLCFRKNITRT